MKILWALSHLRTPAGDAFFQAATWLGEELLLISILCALYWCVNKSLAVQIAASYVCAGLAVQGLKVTFRIPRPWVLDPGFEPVKSAVPAATGYSFPSGHTQGAACLFFPLALESREKKRKVLFCFLFLLVGFSRMYLGCHTPQDVLASLAVSLACSILIWNSKDRLFETLQGTARFSLAAAFAAVFLCGYVTWLHASGTVNAGMASDCFKAAGAALGYAAGRYLEQRYIDFQPKDLTFRQCVIRFAAGLLATVLLKFGLDGLLGSTPAGSVVLYALLIFWIIFLYPYCFTKLIPI